MIVKGYSTFVTSMQKFPGCAIPPAGFTRTGGLDV